MQFFNYFIIFSGIYIILAIVLIVLWRLVRRFKLARKSQQIIYVFFILLGFILVTNFVKPYWYEIFIDLEIINNKGEIVVSDKTADLGSVKFYAVKKQIDLSFQVVPILILAYLINSLLYYFLWQGIFLDEEGYTMVPKLLIQLSNILVYLIALTIVIAIMFPTLLTNFLASVGASGAVAAFLGQQPVKQAFTALSLNLNKQVQKGDFIELNGFTGTIEEIGWKNIKLTTNENNLLIIPNVELVNSIYINYTKLKERFIDIEVVVRAKESPQKVKNLLSRCALDSQYVFEPPFISLMHITDFRATYNIRVLTEHPYDMDVKNEILSSVWYMMRRENLHPDSKQQLIQNPVQRAKELLNNVTLLASLSEEEDELIAQKAEFLRYGHPERVVIQGETDAALFIIAEGNLEVSVLQNDKTNLKVAQLGRNTIFGEMALLTGEPRKATVRAIDDVLVCKISKDTLKPVLAKRPEIMEELSESLAEKQMENERKSAKHNTETEKNKKDSISNKFLSLMKNFFKEDETEVSNVDDI